MEYLKLLKNVETDDVYVVRFHNHVATREGAGPLEPHQYEDALAGRIEMIRGDIDFDHPGYEFVEE